MPDAQPAATVAGQSIALNVTGYPDVPNRFGTGRIRVTALRLDYGNTRSPAGRHAFITGLWVRENGEVTDQPIDQYYDAPDGDTSTWPDWIADHALKHTPTDRAAVLREAAAAIETEQDREEATELARFGELDHETGLGRGYVLASAALLRRLADEAQQQCPGVETVPNRCTCGCEGCKHHCGAHNPAEAQQPDTETPAHPPSADYSVESFDGEVWGPISFRRPTLGEAQFTRDANRSRFPDGWPLRIVRWDETSTVVEADAAAVPVQPAADGSGEEAARG